MTTQYFSILLLDHRKRLIEEIKKLIPEEQYYFNESVKYCGCFKYILKNGQIAQYGLHGCAYLEVIDLEDLPIESLLDVHEKLTAFIDMRPK